MTLTPRPYQTLAIDRSVRQNLLIADQCGLGKSLMACEAAKILQLRLNKPVLIIAPNETVKLQWVKTLIDQGISLTNIIWLDKKGLKEPIGVDQYIVTHYEAMVKWQDVLRETYFSVIVADEAHRCKNRQAKRSKVIKTLRSHRRLALTGTPYDKNPSDIHSILQWLAPEFFTSYWKFFNSHVNFEIINVNGHTIQQPKTQPLKDAASFSRTIRPFMVARKKEDVRRELPPKIDIFIDLEMGKKQRDVYHTIRDANDPIVDLGNGVETSVSITLTKILREIQITTDPALLSVDNTPSVKLEWLKEWLADNPQESVLIGTRFRDTAIKLHKELGDQFKLIVGGDRAVITPQDRYIVGTISAMGEGLDLPHIDNAIVVDREWSSILMQQFVDRIHRINITNAKNVYYLRCINTADILVDTALKEKWNTKTLVTQYLEGIKHGTF